jgi:hypothetical protein
MIKLTNLLKELNIQPKTPIGKGSEHTVYSSEIKPGFVIKKFNDELVEKEQWIENIQLAQQYPEVFAKIDKVDFDKEYYVQEKLDEKSLTKDLNELNNYLEENDILDVWEYSDLEDVLEILVVFPDQINMLDYTPYEKTLKPKLKDFLKRLKTAGIGRTGHIISDLRISNVGYDTAGKIKILDFQSGY